MSDYLITNILPQLLQSTCALPKTYFPLPLIQPVAPGVGLGIIVGAGEERQSLALGESFSAKEAETSIHGNHSLTQAQKE